MTAQSRAAKSAMRLPLRASGFLARSTKPPSGVEEEEEEGARMNMEGLEENAR